MPLFESIRKINLPFFKNDLTEHFLKITLFFQKEQFHKQNDDAQMRSPLSQVIANVYFSKPQLLIWLHRRTLQYTVFRKLTHNWVNTKEPDG